MTDATPTPDDELVSAYLDGEAPEAAARVEADPALRARLAAFRRVGAAVGAPVEVAAADARERAIARALEAAAGEPVVDLDEARARVRARRRSRWLPVAAVAAAVLLLVAAVPLLSRLNRDSGDDLAATAAATTSAAGAGDTSSAEGNEVASQEAQERRDLGVVDDEAALRRAVEDALVGQEPDAVLSASTTAGATAGDASNQPGPADSAAPPAACDDSIAALFPDLGAILLTGAATLRGEPVAVYVYELADPGDGPTRQLLALNPSTCEIVNAQTFS